MEYLLFKPSRLRRESLSSPVLRVIRCEIEGLALNFKQHFKVDQTILSQPNNNHIPNNKTTITVVGFRQSNRWEYHHPQTTTHTNSKLHDTAEIEQNSENKCH